MSDNFLKFVEAHPILIGLIGAISGILASVFVFCFRQIKNTLFRLFKFLWAKIRGREGDHNFEQAYLSWLIRENRYLGLLPAQLVARHWKERQRLVNLEDVFIKLSLSTLSGDEHWTETYGHGENTWRKRPWIGFRMAKYVVREVVSRFTNIDLDHVPIFNKLAEQNYQSGDLALVVDRHKRLIIRGDPGSGKSTLLRYLALTCARALRNKRHEGDTRNTVQKHLLWTEHPFPILVRLRRYGNIANWDETTELTDVMLQEMPFELRKQCPPYFFDRYLKRGNCLILLDALDELGSAEARMSLARKVGGFLTIYTQDSNRIVVTTRIIGYEGQLDQYDFTIRTVQNLDAGEIRALVKLRYAAIAVAEAALHKPQEEKDIQQKMRERAARLIGKIEDTLRLAQLATNPMLLSLMVLVHSLKIELPEERLLLYRDCVEILAESWQQQKREEAGVKKEEREEFSLNQKLILLYELAFAMQRRRKDEGSPALMAKATAQDIIARKLPNIAGGALTQDELAKGETYQSKAQAWIAGIQVDSGILVEQGLDNAGEPVIGFSHLTFQEYLAAVAIHENKVYRTIFQKNLLQPAWREVVLLYSALTNDATSTINALLNPVASTYGVLLATGCLAERLKRVQTNTQIETLEKYKDEFTKANDAVLDDFGKAIGAFVGTRGGNDIIAFMRLQLSNASLKKQLIAIQVLAKTRADDPALEQVRGDLLQLLEATSDPAIRIAAREALSQIGDPRFIGPRPVMVSVPPIPTKAPQLLLTWKDLKASPEWKVKQSRHWRLSMINRVIEYRIHKSLLALRRRRQPGREFEIGKYPVTNIEYKRFIDATDNPAPESWQEGTFSHDKATHPVVEVNSDDAKKYCEWLSKETGERYRLPTAWEWEWAAIGPQGFKYPWGNQFDKDKCNVKESGIEGTTPVGSYVTGNSFCGASDMYGNVWEITLGSNMLMVGILPLFLLSLGPLALVFFHKDEILQEVTAIILFYLLIFVNVICICLTVLMFFYAYIAPYLLYLSFEEGYMRSSLRSTNRGGSWNADFNEVTLFSREIDADKKARGFRCVREIDQTQNP